MRRPWHYWLAYVLGVVVVAVALGWLTREALELDRAEASARRQAELEENIGRALWRMDVRLMPLIAKEAARPHFVYQPFYVAPQPTGTKSPPVLSPSPLLTERPEFILLNFQVDAKNQWTSAQCPSSELKNQAFACGANPGQILECESSMTNLQADVTYPMLLELLPVESVVTWPEPVPSQSVSQIASQPGRGNQPSKFVDNSVYAGNMQQQANVPPAVQQRKQTGDESVRLQRTQNLNTSDLANREAQFQIIAQQEFATQRANYKSAPTATAREGICRPVWIGSRLLLARRVDLSGQVVIQGCWLDWPNIKEVLLAETADLLQSVELEPVLDPNDVRVTRMLATLPVQLIVPAVPVANIWTPIRTALAIAWLCAAFIAIGGAVLLHGVLSLSERRATFVSAVTHELRTPLTTFRLYSEMLAQGMLPDAAQRQKYLDTLRVEADRLAKLVDNVLCFARLERGRAGSQRIPTTVQSLLDRCLDRLKDRAAQAELVLSVESELDLAEISVITDPSAVEQILFNLVDNAAKYASRAKDRRLHLNISTEKQQVAIRLSDHGPGIDESAHRRLFQPFSKSAEDAAHSAPGVGLGLALCHRLAREIGGRLSLEQNSASGASFLLSLPKRG